MKWISVKDKPYRNNYTNVMFICKRHNEICIGHPATSCEDNQYWFDYLSQDCDGYLYEEYEVTHWMPLPEPPENEK